jgi:hypothetical protein
MLVNTLVGLGADNRGIAPTTANNVDFKLLSLAGQFAICTKFLRLGWLAHRVSVGRDVLAQLLDGHRLEFGGLNPRLLLIAIHPPREQHCGRAEVSNSANICLLAQRSCSPR